MKKNKTKLVQINETGGIRVNNKSDWIKIKSNRVKTSKIKCIEI